MSRERLTTIIKTKEELKGVPVVGKVELGHTVPIASFPYGGRIKMKVTSDEDTEIEITQH